MIFHIVCSVSDEATFVAAKLVQQVALLKATIDRRKKAT